MADMAEYIVTLHKKEDLESFYEDMETPGGNLYIPDRAVEVEKRRTISRNTHYMLTAEEAQLVKSDPRVWDVVLADLVRLTTVPSGVSIINGKFEKDNNVDATDINWGLLRQSENSNRANWGVDGTSLVTDDVIFTASGKNVDILLVDGHVDPDHPEYAVNSDGTGGSRLVQYNWFQHTNELGLGSNSTYVYDRSGSYTNPNDRADNNHGVHVGGTIAGNTQGWARESTVYNISPYSSNPNWGVSGLDSTTMWDYMRAWHNSKPVNPETGRKNPTISNHSYGSTLIIGAGGNNTFSISNATNASPIEITTTSNHNFKDGMLVLFYTVGGMTQLNGGLAYVKVTGPNTFELYSDASLSLAINGTFFGTYTSGGFVEGRDPYVTSYITEIDYRGVIFEPGRDLTQTELQDRGCYAPYSYKRMAIPLYFTSRFADIQDAIDDGIIVVAAAGNDYWRTVASGDQDYNNVFAFTFNGFPDTAALHRGTGSGAGYAPVINVGAISNDQSENKAAFSNVGSAVDVFAAGQAIQSSLHSGGTPDPRNSSYRLGKYQGTSMATPQVAGILALLAESWPNMSQAEAQEWIISNANLNQIADTETEDPMDLGSLQGAPNRYARWINQRPIDGSTYPKRNFKPRVASGRTYPRTKIRRRG